MGQNVEFDVIARDRASSTFSKVGKSAKDSGSSISGLGVSAKQALGAVLALQTAKTVTKGLIDMAKAAAEDQTSVALMAKQFKNSANATKQQVAATEAWITKVGIARGVADDQLRPALGNLVTATHNVRKAQELTNLAMDVAAAKGKPLTAVSMALSKAYNGNVGALGRLGIKTKDAEGKTLSFAAAQAEMNKQFGGAAAAKAKTFTGVMDRFHVAVQEGGEAIGYKLLPELTKVVPKISDFITGMQTGTGKGGEFANTVKDDVLPVVKNLATEAKVLVEALRPVVGVLSSLPPQLVATGGAVGILGTKLGSMRAPLEEGASGFAKLGRSAASAAGGAGLLAVADAANRTSPALGGLEGALGGAAAGLAIGGPLGAGIGFVAGGLLGIASSSHKSATGLDLATEAAKKGIPTFSDYASTLNQTTAAITKNTTAMVVQDLQSKGLLETTRALGISDQEVVKGITGGAAARLQLVNDLRDGTVQTEFFSTANEKSKVATLANLQAIQAQIGGLDNQRLGLLQSNLLTAENAKQTREARAALVQYGKTHAVGTAELFGYTTVKKQAADLKATLSNLFNFAANGQKAHPELNNHGTALTDALGGDILAGHRASGGPVAKGRPYVVGEKRPELFVPNQSGRILPSVPASAQFNSLAAGTKNADSAAGLLSAYMRGSSVDPAAADTLAQAQLAAIQAQTQAIQHLEDRIANALGKVGKDAGHEVAEVLGVAVKQANSKGGTHR